MEYVLAGLILIALAWFVTAPLRQRAGMASDGDADDPRIADLEARKEAKYREIRDAELDREAGKLSREDWARQDAELRRDAIEILRELDRFGGGEGNLPG